MSKIPISRIYNTSLVKTRKECIVCLYLKGLYCSKGMYMGGDHKCMYFADYREHKKSDNHEIH